MEEYIKALIGIIYDDWIRLKTGVDRMFSIQKGESEKKLKLADPDKILELVQMHFGY